MQIEESLRNTLEKHRPSCNNPYCQAEYRNITEDLLTFLASPEVTDLRYAGESRLNPMSTWTRSVYEIVHQDGRTLRLALTGMSTIQVFSGRRRSTHCFSQEFRERLKRFANPDR